MDTVTVSEHTAATSTPTTWRRTMPAFTATFVGFPLGGLAGLAIGPVDDAATALLGGAATGAVIGIAQWLVLRRHLPRALSWVAATAGGLAVGLALGASAVGYATGLSDLALQGAITGAVTGLAQAAVLRGRLGRVGALAWALAGPALWSLGWTVTTAFGVAVDQQFTVFGASGALVWSLLGGALLTGLLRRQRH